MAEEKLVKCEAGILNEIEKRARKGKATDREIRLLDEARIAFG